MNLDPYVYMWEYRVHPESVPRFEACYGPEGEWVELFRRAPGYIETLLYRDREAPHRYLTVDVWESAEAFDKFRHRFADEFATLDAYCETLTESEALIGRFRPIRSKS